MRVESSCLLLRKPPGVYGGGAGCQLQKVPPALCELEGAGSQGVTSVEQAEFTRPMQIQIWLCVSGVGFTQERWQPCAGCVGGGLSTKTVSCPSNPHPEATQLSFFLSLAPPEPLSLHQSPECVPASKQVCGGPLSECLRFQQPSVSPRWAEYLQVFLSHTLWGLLFPILVLWAWEPGMRLGPLTP